MRSANYKFLLRCLAFVVSVLLVFPIYALAVEDEAVTPYASYYLDSYQTYVYPAGDGQVQVWFDVTGDNYMDEIGALSIWVYESKDNSSWTMVESFFHEDNPDMLSYDDVFHSSHVTYQGVKGRYYKAYVCIWAGKDGDGDTRYLWTSSKKAT